MLDFVKPKIKILYNGVDKTADMHWTNINIDDNESDLADVVSLTLVWQNLLPRFKDSIDIYVDDNFLGHFIIANIRADYKKSISVEAVSVDMMSDFTKNKNRTFEAMSYGEILQSIANENGYETKLDFERLNEVITLEQHDKSDMNICKEIADTLELTFCVKNKHLIFYDRTQERERISYDLNADEVISLSWEHVYKEIYNSCEVKWQDTKDGITKIARYGNEEPILRITSMCKDETSALKMAQSRLKAQKNKELSGNLSVIGRPWSAGAYLDLSIDGETKRYTIKKVTHQISKSGWITNAEFF
ncbi:phage late control D family protein [Campylobacter sputorum]|uniref:phage late control D family protein n=1 Tax=Campylobacter sputorum TaxID=206 RepID=UPI00053BE49D|nr:phage late control D family protein [Campylobacter sputorum]